MKHRGIIHPELARIVATLGHGDLLCIADAGLPVPPGVPRIDLAYRLGEPRFLDVVQALAAELVVERFTVAEEIYSHSADVAAALQQIFADIEPAVTSHEALKATTRQARAIVRTGETTPYANVLMHSGVPFG